ncbi:MAG: hypothetical protein ACI4F9_01035 [Lachnospiraceae bacterium]
MTAKEYLQQVRSKNSEINNLMGDKEQLREFMYSFGGSPEGERVQSSRNNDRLGSLYARLDKKEREITEKIDNLIDFKSKVSSEINQLCDGRYKEVLYKRYVQMKTWELIAVELNYTYNYVIQLHGQALLEFQKCHKNLLKSL